jgi:hypothetical protein
VPSNRTVGSISFSKWAGVLMLKILAHFIGIYALIAVVVIISRMLK